MNREPRNKKKTFGVPRFPLNELPPSSHSSDISSLWMFLLFRFVWLLNFGSDFEEFYLHPKNPLSKTSRFLLLRFLSSRIAFQGAFCHHLKQTYDWPSFFIRSQIIFEKVNMTWTFSAQLGIPETTRCWSDGQRSWKLKSCDTDDVGWK